MQHSVSKQMLFNFYNDNMSAEEHSCLHSKIFCRKLISLFLCLQKKMYFLHSSSCHDSRLDKGNNDTIFQRRNILLCFCLFSLFISSMLKIKIKIKYCVWYLFWAHFHLIFLFIVQRSAVICVLRLELVYLYGLSAL